MSGNLVWGVCPAQPDYCRLSPRQQIRIPDGWSLALIGNASGRLWGRAESRSEAFSMRRLGGSRWRLRRTRCAMGFERQLVAESKTGRELANWNGGLVIVEGIAGASRGERRSEEHTSELQSRGHL